MISVAKIEKNKAKFIETNQKYSIFTKELEDFLGEDFYVSPASPALDMYGAYPGGLLDHLLKVCKYSIGVNELLPETIKIDKETIIKTVFLTQIGKTFLYKQNTSEWHIKNQGKMYEYRDDEMVVMTIGERSAMYVMKYGVQLTEEQYQAIINSDKHESERFVRGRSKTLSHILRLGFDMALLEEKNGQKPS